MEMTLLALALGIYAVSTLTSMALMSIGAAVALLGMLIAWRGPKGFVRALRGELGFSGGRLYALAALGLAAACVLSLIVARIDPLAYGGQFSRVHIVRDSFKLWYLFWPLPLAAGLRALRPALRDRVIRSWLIAFGVVSVIGIVQFWTGWPRPRAIPAGGGHYHAVLFLGHHLTVASILIFPFFVCLDLFFRSIRDRKPVLGLGAPVWGLFCLLGLATLFFTYSRTLWIALPLGVIAWIVLSLPRKWAVSFAAALVIASLAASQVPLVRDRLLVHMGIINRENLWQANLDMFRARPATGVGWLHNQELSGYYLMDKLHQTDVFSGHAHNNVLEMMSGTGVVGLLSWVFWCIVAFLLAWRARHHWGSGLGGPGLVCAWFVFQLNGLTQVNFWDAKVTHQMMWVVALLLLKGSAD
jgi:O-antigen ligase